MLGEILFSQFTGYLIIAFLATTALLGKLDFKNFTIRINDRRFLKAMAAYSGFKEEDYDSVFITLDKMDKIGLDGVAAELKGNGYAEFDLRVARFSQTGAGLFETQS